MAHPQQMRGTLIAQHDGLRLRYQESPTGFPVDVNELVPFAYTPARFGGRRQWMSQQHSRRTIAFAVKLGLYYARPKSVAPR
jgi:hypothetical protein